MTIALIAIGGNIRRHGEEIEATLDEAVAITSGHHEVKLIERSPWYRSPAFPPGSGPDFVNGALSVETSLSPRGMLEWLHDVEAGMGRQRPTRWAPRVCDLDLIGMGSEVLPDPETARQWIAMDLGKAQSLVPPRLILPHPRMHERAFVLIPLARVAPGWRHPLLGLTVAQLCDRLDPADKDEVTEIGNRGRFGST